MAKKKLTDNQWQEIGERYMDDEPARALAREFGTTDTTIHNRFSLQKKKLKESAKQIVKTDNILKELPKTLHLKAFDLAANLNKTNISSAVRSSDNAEIAKELTKVAFNMVPNVKTVEIDNEGKAIIEIDQEVVQNINALCTVANNAGKQSLEFLKMNIDLMHKDEDNKKQNNDKLLKDISAYLPG